MTRDATALIAVLALALALALPAGAPAASPSTSEFRVNPDNGLDGRASPGVALDDDGELTVVYQGPVSEDQSPPSSTSPNVVVRRFDTGTTLLRSVLASTSPNNDTFPVVAAEPGGKAVVAWVSTDPSAPTSLEVRARRINPALDPPDFFMTDRLDTSSPGVLLPAVVVDADGSNFTIIWSHFACAGPEGSGCSGGVKARRFNAAGTPLGPAANLDAGSLVFDVAPTPDGFVTVAAGSPAGFRRFSVSGNTITPIGAITPFRAASAGNPLGALSIDTDASGGFAVAWGEYDSSGGIDVAARRFDQNGGPLTGDLEVNTVVAGNQILPDVGVAPDGDFAVVWTNSADPSASEDSPSDIRLREFSSAGVPRGSETGVSETDHRDRVAKVAYGADDRLAVAWVRGTYDYNTEHWKPTGHIFARRFVSSTGQDLVPNPDNPGNPGNGGGNPAPDPNPSPGGPGQGGSGLPGSASALMTLPGATTVDSRGNLRVTISCPVQLGPTCDPLLQGTSVQKLALKAAARKRKKQLKLGSRRYSVPQGTKKMVTFKVSKAALRYLKRKKSLKARFTLATGTEKVVKTTTLKLKQKRSR